MQPRDQAQTDQARALEAVASCNILQHEKIGKEETVCTGERLSKKRYSRDDLLKLRLHPLSLNRLDQLPDLPSVVRPRDQAQTDQARAFSAITLYDILQYERTSKESIRTGEMLSKKGYRREDLLKLRLHPLSLKRPDQLPDLSIVRSRDQAQTDQAHAFEAVTPCNILQHEKIGKEETVCTGGRLSKKRYSRDDLLKLRLHPLSQNRPDQLPDLSSIVKRGKARPKAKVQTAQAQALAAVTSYSAGYMTDMQGCGGESEPLPSEGYQDVDSGKGLSDMQPQQEGPRQINSDDRDGAEQFLNACKVSHNAAPGEVDEDSRVIEAFKDILDKITPNNIKRLTGEMKQLALDTEHRLHEVVMALFNKAVDEPMYAGQCAKICASMSNTEATGADGTVVNFRKLLMAQCQREFEKNRTFEPNRDERQKEINSEKDEEKKKKMEFDLKQESVKIRHRYNNNILFIGELYKLVLLTGPIMHQCITKLLKDKHDDSYECLCTLMTNIGQKLETAERNHGRDLNQMFNDFHRLASDKSLQPHTRSMFQDLVDMHNNGWVSTRTVDQAKPVVIKEVHQPEVRTKPNRFAYQAQAFDAAMSSIAEPMAGIQNCGGESQPLPSESYRDGGFGNGLSDTQPQQEGPRQMQNSGERDGAKESRNARKVSSKAAPGEVDEDSRVIKAFKDILDKMTPNNIERVTAEIKKLALDTEHRLHEVVMALFNKAVDEPMYAGQCAKICASMNNTEATGADGNVVNFRRLLLIQCQREFEKDKTAELNCDERQKEVNAEKDEEKKKKMEFDLKQDSVKIQHRYNGNILFIGELYKWRVLTDEIMHRCITKLLKDKCDDSYECLCMLMTNIGQKLETSECNRGKDFDQMLDNFSRLASDKSLQPSTRSMFQDLVDMRNNGWVSTLTLGQTKPMATKEVRNKPVMFGTRQEHGDGREGAKSAVPAVPTLKGPAVMDDGEMQGTVRLICEGYIGTKDYELSIQDIEEKLHVDTIAKFIGVCLTKYVDEPSSEQRHLVGELHRNMLESGHVRSDAYLTGTKELLEFASDLLCDIPLLLANLGELLAPPLTTNSGVTLEALAVPAASIVANNCGGKLIISVLKRLKSLHGTEKMRSLVPSGFDWKLYFGSDDHVQPLVNSQLGFLVAGAKGSLPR